MASSDVIELGSSEDEAEPVPKKKKPTLNAMVHFPNKAGGLMVKPTKPALPPLQKVLASGAVTITNVKKSKFPTHVNKPKPNGRAVQVLVQRPPIKVSAARNILTMNPIAINNLSVNPLSVMRNPQTVPIPRLPTPRLNLPGITIKRAPTSQNMQHRTNILPGKKKPNLVKRKQPAKIITTVELDDEEVPLTSGTSPQWYLRPEEQSKQETETETKEDNTKDKQDNDNTEKNVNMELENNREPDTKNYIEITIEDSPIKHLQVRKGFEVGTELPITIEDSPIKPLKSLKDKPSASDSDVEKSIDTEPQSKKKLDYPKDDEDSGRVTVPNVVEIDLELVPSADECKEKKTMTADADVNKRKKDNEIKKVETPISVETELITKETRDEEKSSTDQKNESGEFHPVYQKFIDLCFELENSDDMTKIVEKKIKTYYRQCPKDYVESEEFTDMVSSKIFAMRGAPDKMYLYIKDVVDELNLQRKSAKAMEVSNKENKSTVTEDDNCFIVDDGEYDTKRRRQIRKLDKTIKKLHRAIQKLEEQEVEFEDEEDSVYLLTERYKERLIRVHAKFCQLTNTKMPSEPRIQIDARPGCPTGPAKRLEKWVNKKVPIGTPLPFPDFHDVLRCVRVANEEDRLGWNEADVMEEARDLFVRCGKKLKRRRQENEWRIAASRISQDASTLDPAEKSDDLRKKLEDNKTVAAKKEIEVFNKYAAKQNQLKLVGEEIGDKEAEESPVESEEDEGNDESNSLANKQKRKERLKRLLHEKTRKLSSEKENINEVEVSKKANEVKISTEGEQKMEVECVSKKAKHNEEELRDTKMNKEENDQEVAEESKENTVMNVSEGVSNSEQKIEKNSYSDSYDVDSDIDELHLLQELYSENEINSSTQESDSDTPIAISDTLESDSENDNVKKQQNCDIISIENSSYSESEDVKDESENKKASEVKKDKNIEGLLLENAEVFLVSSTPKDKMDIDEENILLASSEDEDVVDDNSRTDNVQESACVKSIVNIVNDDCQVIDNCDNNSVESDIVMCDDPLNREDKDKINKVTTGDSFENNNKPHLGISENISQQSKKQVDTSVIDKGSCNKLDSLEGNQDNKSNDVIMKDVYDEANSIVSEMISENNKTSESYKCNKNSDVNNSLEGQCPTDNVKNIKPSTEINSKHELRPGPNITNGEEETASSTNETHAHSTQLELNECEVMDVNIDIASESSLTRQQNTCKDGEGATSVQCK